MYTDLAARRSSSRVAPTACQTAARTSARISYENLERMLSLRANYRLGVGDALPLLGRPPKLERRGGILGDDANHLVFVATGPVSGVPRRD